MPTSTMALVAEEIELDEAALSQLRAPILAQCEFSCDTVESPKGIYIDLRTFRAFGEDLIPPSAESYYINFCCRPVPRTDDVGSSGGQEVAPEDLETGAIGRPNFVAVSHLSLCRFAPDGTLRSLPLFERRSSDESACFHECSVESLRARGLSASAARVVKEVLDVVDVAGVSHENSSNASGPGPTDLRPVSALAERLVQIAEPVNVGPPASWKCAECGRTANLWLHLADGFIGCGRRHYGVAESGCADGREGAAVRHWEENPATCTLAVKLGSLGAAAAPEVYSYGEDEMVTDPHIDTHLAHFGIARHQMARSEKTLAELQLEHNQRFQWSRVPGTEGENAVPLNSPFFVGMRNFGNSCYVNVVMTLLSRVPPVVERLGRAREEARLLDGGSGDENFALQVANVLLGLTTARYVQQHAAVAASVERGARDLFLRERPTAALRPLALRRLIPRLNREFAPGKQQDVDEFLRFVLERLGKDVIEGCFDFQVEQSLRFRPEGLVRLKYAFERVLTLNLPSDAATIADCLDLWTAPDAVVISEAGKSLSCEKSRRMQTLPPYLLVQMQRFRLNRDFQLEKRCDAVQVPCTLDLARWLASGAGVEEREWKDEGTAEALTHAALSEEQSLAYLQLLEMGFGEERTMQALTAVPSGDLFQCLEWLDGSTKAGSVEAIARVNRNETESSVYDLIAFTTHLGPSINCGHYVTHCRRDDPAFGGTPGADPQWAVFNDEKVSTSAKPPIDQGYMYLFRKREPHACT